ncbi:H-2 class I histocompatibility antigen, K-Q alpha chain-like [Syngnathus typhle]|uniref:H-2 class I histocompatibility antigen, K-Q alpha chain-like n=1 Tax=Syngnathus typhle TaxID=161592 RepID=UPI002A6B6B29|nr:H-2 class I histocompatibility antigen, K-Q alpha chain-like [Syngnathus typhle]
MLAINLLVFFVAAVQIYSVAPIIRTLNYFKTSSQVAKLPEFLEAAHVDGVQIQQFDSNHRDTKAKHDRVNKITEDNPHFWEIVINIQNEQNMKDNIETAKKHFNTTGGVHMIQVISACERDDETGEVDGWEQYCYDGEYFLSFEGKTKWIAANLQAFIPKLQLIDGYNEARKNYSTEECPSDLKKHVNNGKDFLTRTELPKVSLPQKTPSSPVTCHATGFYPITSSLFWRKNSEEIHEDVEMRETRPNHDRTFQTSVHLKVEVTPAAEQEYECVFRLAGVSENIVIKLDAGSILSNQEEQDRKKAVAIGVPLVVLALVAVVMFFAERLKSKHKCLLCQEPPKRTLFVTIPNLLLLLFHFSRTLSSLEVKRFPLPLSHNNKAAMSRFDSNLKSQASEFFQRTFSSQHRCFFLLQR